MLRLDRNLMMAALAAGMSFAVFSAEAGVVISGTRVVFPAEKREVSLRLENNGEIPSLVQAWIDNGEGKVSDAGAAKVPFLIRPPIFRIDGGRSQVLRLVHSGEPMPQDRESLYYFNVLDVPANKASASAGSAPEIRLIVRTQLKLFYRPKGLSREGAQQAPKKLKWSVVRDDRGWALQADNPTAYHVAVADITAGSKVAADVAPPFTTTSYRLTQTQYNALGTHITFSYTNDHGALHQVKAPLTTH
ncbi:fimbria/pilus periplasmic chaperone [Stenotrophomonas sp. RAC2]|uniref:fimbrial biogenesis chaperone n=1 Tax=Stenotrophomonas sp. RAC2 TaxID=3064902 RepID=UPI00271A7068|nr:fimbria/pilus periplasmic chaperone [Stenotrophomonas sp. RAC2]MDV9043864.1 fimbria/pilus periplasmic chaperone [Stenotrophomonas sp. RAC2]